ncbi:YicC/YloC family endoribonuclease [Thermospira aquatica]|uniref:YicC family protein n=1 Tax=Thermospira aquatica TaxID=2828656 RepID=A0AAX3BD55_9SPIR|nr:YicC/YloC family endoribonuclease [Thermospira aquatica]URA10237.1 YicC family protein [Thermospira aquatica]
MLRSMTGYARSFVTYEDFDVEIELKSVNSRYFEFRLLGTALPAEWENEFRQQVFAVLKRGKIDLFMRVVEKSAKNSKVVLNMELAQQYYEALLSLSKKLGIATELTLRDLLSLGLIVEVEKLDADVYLFERLKVILDDVLTKITEMMRIEGQKTVQDIQQSLGKIQQALEVIETRYPESLSRYQQELQKKLLEFSQSLGESTLELLQNRLLLEMELVASRVAINEEIVRLKSHLHQFLLILEGKLIGDGKKLDFIAQEMNRETNTIASKSQDYEIAQATIEIKGEIEKIREQLRNLE